MLQKCWIKLGLKSRSPPVRLLFYFSQVHFLDPRKEHIAPISLKLNLVSPCFVPKFIFFTFQKFFEDLFLKMSNIFVNIAFVHDIVCDLQ